MTLNLDSNVIYFSIADFFKEVEKKAYAHARYAIKNHDQALDIVQDSMESMLRNYTTKPQQQWHALFFTIVRNKVGDIRRKQKVRANISLASEIDKNSDDSRIDVIDRVASATNTPEQNISNKELGQRLKLAIDRLPTRQHDVFILREKMQYSINEVCEILDLSSGAVKQHHFRALQQLRNLLAEVWSDE